MHEYVVYKIVTIQFNAIVFYLPFKKYSTLYYNRKARKNNIT